MISNIKPIRKVRPLVRYLLHEEAHTEGKDRTLLVKGINCSVRNVAREFDAIRKHHNKINTIEAYSIVKSWDSDELNADNPEDIELAMRACEELVKAYGDDRQALIVLQNDGTGGKLHAHILIANVSLDGKCFSGQQTGWRFLKRTADSIQEELQILNKNKERKAVAEKTSMVEVKMRERGEYVWLDDLRSRVDSAINDKVTSIEQLELELQKYDVKVNKRDSKQSECGYNLAYTFTDFKGTQRKARQKRLGDKYTSDALEEVFRGNRERQRELEIERLEEERRQREHAKNAQKEVVELMTADSLLKRPRTKLQRTVMQRRKQRAKEKEVEVVKTKEYFPDLPGI